MSKKLSKEIFIERSNIIHNNIYDYSQSEINGVDNKTIIICKEHGEFLQIPKDHMKGRGCWKCGTKNRGYKVIEKFSEEFIQKSKKIHNNKYIYSSAVYNGANQKIEIICPIHGSFWQTVSDHLSGYGCSLCANENRSLSQRKTLDEFIRQVNEIHQNKFDYSKSVYINDTKKIEIICTTHGSFWQSPNAHIRGQGCPKCKTSKGENIIREWLIANKIDFEEQKRFEGCKYKKPLPFDFWLPKYNICIEFDGQQHYKVINRSKNQLKNLQAYISIGINDIIKTTYCIEKGIPLIRIPFSTQSINDFLSKNYFNLLTHGV